MITRNRKHRRAAAKRQHARKPKTTILAKNHNFGHIFNFGGSCTGSLLQIRVTRVACITDCWKSHNYFVLTSKDFIRNYNTGQSETKYGCGCTGTAVNIYNLLLLHASTCYSPVTTLCRFESGVAKVWTLQGMDWGGHFHHNICQRVFLD